MNAWIARRFRSARHLLLAVALFVSLAGIALATPSWATTTTVYAALGDSYSSGVGASPYDPSSGSCSRSPQSAVALWAAGHPDTAFTFAACGGATTTDVLTKQLGALSAATTQVTLTIGGNDAGFTTVLQACLQGSNEACVAALTKAEAYMTTILPGQLDTTYAAIRKKAPQARLIVFGYPQLFELSPACQQSSFDLYKRRLINHGADLLNQVIATRVATTGATFIDVRPAFAGHGICSTDPWIHAITSPAGDSFHPSPAGYRFGYLPALVAVTG